MKLLQIGRGLNILESTQMLDGATFGCGATMAIGTTTITQLNSITPPGFDSDDIDVTTHDNTNGFRSFIKGLTDAGEIEVEGNFDYTLNYSVCYELMVTRTLQTITITVPTEPSATKWECSGYCKSLETEAPVDDKIPFNATIKVSGRPILTQA